MSPERWKAICPSQFAWESEALEFLREGLPDRDPYRAWSNFEFVADDGTINEIDALILTPMGLFLVEIKSRPGELTGDSYTWTWRHEGRVFTDDNPLLLANRKARKLAALLKRQKPFKERGNCPFVEPVVFCSAASLKCQLSETARQGVFLRDGIIDALLNRKGLPRDQAPVNRLGDATARDVLHAMEALGIRPTQRSRRVGDYQLDRLFCESPTGVFQDWIAHHVALPETTRVVRIYPMAPHATREWRQQLQRFCEREFMVLQDLVHPGIALAESFTLHEIGPAIVFRLPPQAQRLDHYLAERGGRLEVTTRLDFTRQLAEALKFAHDHKVIHHALSPQSVIVLNPDAPVPDLQIFNWQTYRRSAGTGSTTGTRITATLHTEQLIDDTSAVYLAPEAQLGQEGNDPAQDIFSLGALTYYLFTGQPPASSPVEMTQRVTATRGLDLSDIVDAPSDALRDLVKFSTHPDRLARHSAADFLHKLNEVEEELTTPDSEVCSNPLEARPGDRLPGGLIVRERLGQGSTAVALLVTCEDREYVLKVANRPESNDRIQAEFAALGKLDHPGIIRAEREVVFNHLRGFLMERAGKQTLAARLREEGPLDLGFLERFGVDLIEAVQGLEKAGVAHRDIKPENIGVRERGKQSELHLVLFDFSLTSAPAENIRCGTHHYLDPFLIDRHPPRWDLAAERFAVAVTLHEMATGDLPRWGDGRTSPAALDCEVTLLPERFPAALRERLTRFFERALRRDYRKRFDNAAEMLAAWKAVFESVDRPPAPAERDEDTRAIEAARLAAIEAATLNTQLIELHLSTRAANALDRLNAITVRDLLKVPVWRLNRLRGVGKKTVREIGELHSRLRKRFPDAPSPSASDHGSLDETERTTEESPAMPSIDWVAQQIRTVRRRAERDILHVLLGIPTDAVPDPLDWPSQTEVARRLEITRQRVGQVAGSARGRWQKLPFITDLRTVTAELLNANGGVMTVRELADALLAARGSTLDETERQHAARVVLRAIVETESAVNEPRFIEARSDGRVLIAVSHDLADYAFKLGDAADDLARQDPLPTPTRVVEVLRQIRIPAGVASLSEARLVKLAAGASRHAALSSRLEIYPRGLDPRRAVQLAAGALLGTRDLSVEEVHQRVLSRYPEATPLPGRPELDRLLEAAGTRLQWDDSLGDGAGGYRQDRQERITLASLASTRTTPIPPVVEPDEVLDARDFDRRLRRSLDERAYLVLVTEPVHYLEVEKRLRTEFKPRVVDLDAALLSELREGCRKVGARWEVVLAADAAAPGSPDWQRLQILVQRGLDQLAENLTATDAPLLLIHPGLLARYGRLDFLNRLQDALRDPSDHGPRAIWVLVPSSRQHQLPTLHGVPIPVPTRGQWSRVPESWLQTWVAA